MASKKKLNEYCQAHGLKVLYEIVGEEGPPHDPKFTIKAVINKKEYPPAEGQSKKKAEDAAAKAALESIEKEGKPECASNVQPLVSLLPPAPLADVEEKKPLPSKVDYISLLSQYGQKNHCMVTYSEELQSGLPHLPKFTCSCKISGNIYGKGIGNSKQEAKYAAAKEAYYRLTDSENSRTEDQPSIASSTADESSDTSEVTPQSVSNDAYSLNSADTGKTNDNSSSCQAISRNAVKSKRGGVTLAPKFSHPEMKENKYTMNGRFLKDFEGIEFIGSGGFANVFKAKHKYDGKTYAIKQVTLDDKVKREVEALSNLSHENIIRYYTCWSGDDFIFDENNSSQRKCRLYSCLFIQMEFCEKGTLMHWIDEQRGKQHNQGVSLNIFKQIVKGVEYIHSEGLVHRDLKPQNIFISREDKIKIGDFGLVTSVKDEPRTKNKGTKSYMSPEQDGDTYEQEVDIYALGLIFFEILWIFPSAHEKVKLWPEIRKGTFPDAFNTQFRAEKYVIDQLLSADPKKRPAASNILDLLKVTSKNIVTASRTH
ncbi:PREDICTED: interferon-induced, double-stranded RNA-activated protein kinase [Crocodylus porosus]|uniref:non-specific serine/threonine protein kinase n=1 Tax=Crocodylus porosus TaxID=8502 RepID=A0A7M4F3Z6_CROPO|nr:PREDICTED: interferon-induced, double-stranded RNA-activated protein kinase [Crocodylus porosus]